MDQGTPAFSMRRQWASYAPAKMTERRVNHFDEAQIAFWRQREAEERNAAALVVDGARAVHLKLADSYAILIAQTRGEDDANMAPTR